MGKALALLAILHGYHKARMKRLEEHVAPGNKACCCYRWKPEGWWVYACLEGSRLAYRVHQVESRSRVVMLLVLENVHARG